MYVYDMSRANRDIVESHRLARLLKSLRKNMIGVADGFDLSSPQADMQLMVMSMVSDIQVKNVRQRGSVGMRGAVRRGTSIGKPPLGYMLIPFLDHSGRPCVGGKGRQIKKWLIDPGTKPYVEMIFRMFGIEHRSLEGIQNALNAAQVGGKASWWANNIKHMLANPIYIGVHVYGRFREHTDPETGRFSRSKTPRNEWVISKRPELRIISDDLWKAARRRAREVHVLCPNSGRKVGQRSRLYPKTLFSGTLFCAHCGSELMLIRGGCTPIFACNRGQTGVGGCGLRSKSVKLIEECLLRHIRDGLLGPETINTLVAQANEFLREEAGRPRVDTGPLKAQLDEISEKIDRLTGALEGNTSGLLQSVIARIEAHERRKRQLQKMLRDVDTQNREVPSPLTVAEVSNAVRDLRALLERDVAMAAPVIRSLTGPISIRPQSVPGKKRPLWIATFKNDVVPILANTVASTPGAVQSPTAMARQSTDPCTLEALTLRGWKFMASCKVEMDAPFYRAMPPMLANAKYKVIAEKVGKLREAGLNWSHIAKACGVQRRTAQAAVRYGSGQLRPWQRIYDRTKPVEATTHYEVATLHNVSDSPCPPK